MVESQWYVARDGQTFGPFTSDRISKGAHDGELRDDDLVWREGMAYCLPVAQVAEIWGRSEPSLPSRLAGLGPADIDSSAEPNREPSREPARRAARVEAAGFEPARIDPVRREPAAALRAAR